MPVVNLTSAGQVQLQSNGRSRSGLTIKRGEVPFGTVRAQRMTVTYQGDIRPTVDKYGNGAVFFLQPASDNGWSQKVHNIQVRVDGKHIQPNMKDWLDRPAYVVPVDKSSKDFFAKIEFTLFDRVIKKTDRNPNPVTLSQSDREKYTADYTVLKGIVEGKNKEALRQAGLLLRPGESEWDFVERVMQDCISKKRWKYSEKKAEWPRVPSNWLNGPNIGNCDDINLYLVWVARENKIPARQVVKILPAVDGNFTGHGSVEFFSSVLGAWVPADLVLPVSRIKTVKDSIGTDELPKSNGILRPYFVGSDDRSYYFFNSPGGVGNVDVRYGGVAMFAAREWGKAPVLVGSPPVFSPPDSVEIVR